MADRIKGITVEIGGDTTGLSKALGGVNRDIRDTQSQLKDVERLLKLDPTNTELLAQKQRLLAVAIDDTKEKLNTLKETVDAATTIAKREQQEKEKIDFYRLKLSDVDKDEIKILRTVEPHLRNKEALNKVIWKVYYEKPYTDLIGRVIGNKIKTGIYKITNIENQMCYVGQSVDIASRWKQHIKRGIGAEAPTRNKLYPAMISYGPENFTYEIIEECPKEQLDEKEKYWQNFYNALTYGYSMR